MKYEVLDHTADLMIKGYGKNLEECYESVAYGMFDQTVDLSGVEPKESRHVEIEGMDEEDALYSILSELLFIENYDNLILCEFKMRIDGLRISCDCSGELLDKSRMRIRGEIKAVTFHMMEIDPETPSVTVLFDVRSPGRMGPGTRRRSVQPDTLRKGTPPTYYNVPSIAGTCSDSAGFPPEGVPDPAIFSRL